MALNFSTLVYLPNFDIFSRPIIVTPLASQPGLPAYNARGIFSTRDVDVGALDGSIVSDQQSILDVREIEFTVVPQQLDRIHIPADPDAGPALGDFEVVDADTNGGGETTLAIRKIQTAKPQ
jgi:hypothetical protein